MKIDKETGDIQIGGFDIEQGAHVQVSGLIPLMAQDMPRRMALVCFLLAAASFFIGWLLVNPPAPEGILAQGKVTEIDIKTHKHAPYPVVTFIDGQNRKIEFKSQDRPLGLTYKKGQDVLVRYKSENPERTARIETGSGPSAWATISLWMMGVVFLFLGFYCLRFIKNETL